MSTPFDLTGRTALITGGAVWLVLAFARALYDAGARVILNGRDPARLAEAAATVGAQALAFDVTDPVAVRTAVDGFEAAEGPIDILVNNAGRQHRGPLQDFPPEAFAALIEVNVTAMFHVAQAVARHMIARGRGRIINIASVQTYLARPGIAPYGASKAAVAGLTRGMAADWARHGLQCNALAPGYFATPMNAALVADPEFSAWLTRRTPAGRWGRVEELGGAIVFLASDAASFVNGTVLVVDGGLTATV